MAVQYNKCSGDAKIPYYVCRANLKGKGARKCQSMQSFTLDSAISNMILETLTPLAISAAIEIEQESKRRKAASDNYFIMQVERARYELDLAKRRYMNVDPANRLVTFELERLWNEKIVDLSKAEEELNRHNREKNAAQLNYPISTELGGLAGDVYEIWNSDKMRIQDKKRIVRCLIENVTITRNNAVATLAVLFKTGATRVIVCDNMRQKYMWSTGPAILNYIRSKSTAHSTLEISDMLNQNGHRTGKDEVFTSLKVRQLMRYYSIPTFETHLRERGYLYSNEKAALLGISTGYLGKLRQWGTLDCEWFTVDEIPTYMYAPGTDCI